MSMPILSLITFLVSPILSLPITLTGIVYDRKNRHLLGIILAILIGYIFLSIDFDATKDMYRYLSMLDEMIRYSFADNIKDIWSNSDPLSYTIMYIVSLIFEPKYIVFIAPLICYPIYLWIISDYSERKKINTTTERLVVVTLLAVLLVSNTFLGIRYGIAVATFILALYKDDVEKKRIVATVLYAASILLHSSMALVVILRISLGLLKKFPWIWHIAVIISLTSLSIIQSLAGGLSEVSFLNTLSGRVDVYIQAYSPIGMVYFISIAIAVIVLASLLAFKGYARYEKGRLSTMFHINLAIMIIATINLQNYYIASRYFTLGKILFCITVIPILSNISNIQSNLTKKIASYSLSTALILLIILSIPLQINGILDYNYDRLTESLIINTIWQGK